jgi:hypothetical protein
VEKRMLAASEVAGKQDQNIKPSKRLLDDS